MSSHKEDGISKEVHSRESLQGVHRSVLLQEVLDGAHLSPGATFVDATINGGGHSVEIVERYGNDLTLLGIDADRTALTRAREKLASRKVRDLRLVESNFRHLGDILKREHILQAHAILLDLGLSSDQLELSGRGFSFQRDEPLLMTFSENPESLLQTAFGIVNHMPERELEQILREYGEDPQSRRIARAIVAAREKTPIDTSLELATVIERVIPRRGKTHPATRTFQALRMAVNDELGALRTVLPIAFEALTARGRLLVISFHSGEDRIVKQYFRELAESGVATLITKKPIIPSKSEMLVNSRSRSAKLRIIEKV